MKKLSLYLILRSVLAGALYLIFSSEFEFEDLSRFAPESLQDLFFLFWITGVPVGIEGIAAIPLGFASKDTKKLVLFVLMFVAFSWEYFIDISMGFDESFVRFKVPLSIALFVIMYWKLLFGQRTY